ncbi:MAG: glycosyltransferase family 9 protein [Kiritimatiellae bacterium]|nr:glycosyltransferase family 9 protein [Kiritimatiellia bacterium]
MTRGEQGSPAAATIRRTAPWWLRTASAVAAPLRCVRALLSRRRAVLVLRLDSFGDALLFTGALSRIRSAFPDCRLSVACRQRTAGFFKRHCEGIDRIIPVPSWRPGLRGIVQKMVCGVKLFSQDYALLLNPTFTSGGLSHQLSAFAAAERKVWFAGNSPVDDVALPAAPESVYTELVPADVGSHELDKTVTFLQAVGVADVHSREDVWPRPKMSVPDEQWAGGMTERLRAMMAEPLVMALCAGAGYRQKDWGAAKYATFLNEFSKRRRTVVALLGTSAECAGLAAVAQGARQGARLQIVDLAGQTTVGQAMALIARCDICVGNDTFGLHAATALDVPSVVIMGGGDFGRWNPWQNAARHATVHSGMACFGCGWRCTQASRVCVESIRVEDVLTAVERVLDFCDVRHGA